MVNTLIDTLLPLTALLLVLLLSHNFIAHKLSVRVSYALWLLVPFGLISYLIPLPWQTVNNIELTEIQRYLVKPSEQVSVINTLNFIWLWFVGTGVIIALWLVSHVNFSEKLQLTKIAQHNLPLVIPSQLDVYQSSQAYSPMLIGFFKQKLVIPENFFEIYNQDQQVLILEHEICHFDRNDIYWNFIALSCVALFWFHPLVWLAYFSFRQDQEISCDQTVLARKQTQSRINYSKALLVAAENAPPLAFAQLSFKKYGDKHLMFERIKQIKANKQATTLGLAMVVATSVTLLSGLSYAGNLSSVMGNNGQQSSHQQKHRTPPKVKEAVKPIMRVEPRYPLKAANENIEGSVVLKFDVATDGSVQNVEVVKGEPAYVFDRVAVTALKQWQYKSLNEVSKHNLVQLDFRLDENSTYPDLDMIEKIKVTK